MEFLTGRFGTGRTADGRGQLLFLTALGLAVLMVVLTVGLNAAADTGRTGPDGTANDPTVDAVRFHVDAERAVAAAMANANEDGDRSYDDLESTVAGSVQQWSDLAVRHAAVDGSWVAVNVIDTTDGTRFAQTNDSRALTDVDGNQTWTLASGADRLRAFDLRLTNDSLATVTQPAPSPSFLENADVFTVVVEGTEDQSRVFVYRNDSGVAMAAVDPGDGTLDDPCPVPVGPEGQVVLDLTDARAADGDCSALDALDELAGPYAVQFQDGTSAAGTYSFVVDTRYHAVDRSNYAAPGNPTDPTASRALYATTVSIAYDTPDLRSTVERRVAPGEIDD